LRALPLKISGVIKPWAESDGNHPALVESSGTWTYGQLADVLRETQHWLLGLGVRPGDRVMLVCENCCAYVAILMALAEIDAWAALVNARLSAREVDEIRTHCGARLVIYFTNVSHQAREHAKRNGASTQNVGNLGSLAVGSIDAASEPEPVDT